jgi:hypothetical protein
MFKVVDLLDSTEKRLAIAKKVYCDFVGKSKNGGLTLTRYDGIILVDDDYDKWLANFIDYDDSLEGVIEAILCGKLDGDISDCYNQLCSDCPALYSRISSGEYNGDLSELVEYLKEQKLNDWQIEDIFNEIGEDIESALTSEEEPLD